MYDPGKDECLGSMSMAKGEENDFIMSLQRYGGPDKDVKVAFTRTMLKKNGDALTVPAGRITVKEMEWACSAFPVLQAKIAAKASKKRR